MYTAGWNMPGYLPEMDPEEFDDFYEAKQFILEEVEAQRDDEEDDEIANKWDFLLERIEAEREEFSIIGPDGYMYWAMDDETGSRRGL